MRAVLQRVSWARVRVLGEVVGEIGPGFLVLIGIGKGDSEALAEALASKVAYLRVFEDEQGKMNRSLLDTAGSCLVVSQFTLYADTRRGRRPFFGEAEQPEIARPLCEAFMKHLGSHGITVASGRFGAMMQVELCNDGPVTICLDTAEVD